MSVCVYEGLCMCVRHCMCFFLCACVYLDLFIFRKKIGGRPVEITEKGIVKEKRE